jgi:hypothetical protein
MNLVQISGHVQMIVLGGGVVGGVLLDLLRERRNEPANRAAIAIELGGCNVPCLT